MSEESSLPLLPAVNAPGRMIRSNDGGHEGCGHVEGQLGGEGQPGEVQADEEDGYKGGEEVGELQQRRTTRGERRGG